MKERQRQNTTRFDFSCADFASNDWGTNVVVLSKFAVFQVCCSDIDDFSLRGSAKRDYEYRYHYFIEKYIHRA